MKKALILTASTGGGHNKVAQTLKEELFDLDYEVEVLDFLKSQTKIYELVVSHGYEVLASKFPTLYGELYKASNTENHSHLSPLVLRAIRHSEKSYTKKAIKEYNPDLIVTTHPFAAAAVGGLKADVKIEQPIVAVVTDFMAHRAYLSEGIDHYIVASEFTKKRLIRAGINTERVHTFGIPVEKIFYEILDEKEKKFTVLIMGGSMGLSQMQEVVDELVNETENIHYIIVTGNNHELYEKLQKTYSGNIYDGSIELYGFTKEVHKLMDRSHLIVTKPGGLTVSESIIKELPIIVPFYIPGQEYENLVFLNLHGAAVGVESPELLPLVISHLQENPEDYKRIKAGMCSIKEQTNRQGFKEIVKRLNSH